MYSGIFRLSLVVIANEIYHVLAELGFEHNNCSLQKDQEM